MNTEPIEGTVAWYAHNTTKLIQSMTPTRAARLEELMQAVESARNAQPVSVEA